MQHAVSEVKQHFSPSQCHALRLDKDYSMDEMANVISSIGVGFNPSAMKTLANELYNGTAMDSIQNLAVTNASIPTPVQFLQNWLVGFVATITAARKIDDLIGITTVGTWEDEQIVQQVLELTGTPTPYGDMTNVPFSSWNQNFVTRSVVRFEQGMKVGRLEEARSARAKIDSAAQKRTSCGLQLEVQRNAVGFYGYNSGLNLTYGFLNDPNLPNYQTVATVGGHTTWATKTFLEIQGDLLTALQTLRTQSQDMIEPNKTPITLAVSTNCVDYLAKTSDFGISVKDWLSQFYPNVTVKSAPQLNAANSGANVFYMFADKVADGLSTDDQNTFIQVVPAKFQLLGVSQQTKTYEEDYSNATAGVMVKRPFAVYRATGI